MKPTLIELILYAVINYIPYIILALMPFASVFRYSRFKTGVIFYSFSAAIIALFIGGYYMGSRWHVITTYLITILSIAAYFICVKSRWGRMLFNLFMIKNVANFVVIMGKALEAQLFPDNARTLYLWSNSLCMLVVLAFIAPLIIFMIHYYFSKPIRDAINPAIWRFLWLIPVYFYAIWLYSFYYSSDKSSLELALEPGSAVFMAVFLCGQLFIYACIANLVISFSKTALLEEENHMLADQSIQYKSIQNRIQDITRIKHDLRHHIITVTNFADEGKYDELKEYLHRYIDMLPEHRLAFCKNAALNMLLAYYDQKCLEEKITFNISLNIPETIRLSDSDVTVMFGNLLENAVDACTAMPSDAERFISVNGRYFQNQLIFVIKNTYINSFTVDRGGSVHSTKHEGFGIGTSSIRNIVQKHNGTLNVDPDGTIFTVSIIIPFYEDRTTDESV